MRALVTGGAGFLGSHLADALLARGWQVTALDDLSTGSRRNVAHLLEHPRFRLTTGSVLDPGTVGAAMAGADQVFHLAAAVGVRLIVEQPLSSLVTNIRGTETVLEAAAREGAKLLVASTSEIYGKVAGGPSREDDDRVLGSLRKLRWSYSISKSVDEILAYAYHLEQGLPVVVARIFNAAGPRQSGRYGMVIPRLVGQALRSEPLTVYGDGCQTRSFTYVGDVVEAMVRLMEAPAAEGEVFNVAGREEVTIVELARRIIQRTGSRSPITFVPFREVFGDGFEDMERRVADPSRMEAATGFRCGTPLDEILDRVIEAEREAAVPE
ncbi:MAG TPA: NAD-dependent epimerase/dehydratase family protein [Candidatus Dormibacteraeota bacterium]|nr:NAD-dependent epimerase/dehydratase family protein [Candidatus Dormibacteraeota bacterium]